MKLFGVVALAVLVALAAAQSHNVTFGFIGRYDNILHKQYYVAKPRWMQTTTTDITYPPKGIFGRQNITAIRVTDNFRNGTGGYATLVAGGPGYRNVTVRLQTQKGKGYNMLVEILGK